MKLFFRIIIGLVLLALNFILFALVSYYHGGWYVGEGLPITTYLIYIAMMSIILYVIYDMSNNDKVVWVYYLLLLLEILFMIVFGD